MSKLPVVLAVAVALTGCAKPTPVLQSQLDQAAAAREGRAYRGPGAGPEQNAAEYERLTAQRLAQVAPPAARQRTALSRVSDAAAISQSRKALTDELRDPMSAQFRDVKVGGNCDGAKYVTGYLNAKNGYGGYVGFRVFLTRVEGSSTIIMQSGGNAYATEAEFKAAAVCNGTA